MDLITVIVPVYNVEKYLKECLNSLLVQTYQQIEVIMVDDGSKDSSGRICDEYASKNENFYVIHKQNAGLGMARNTGMDHMRGEYVTFIDSDDYVDAGYVENLYKNVLKNHVDMCKSGFLRVLDSKEIVSCRKYENMTFEGKSAGSELLPRMLGSAPNRHDSVEPCVCGAIYKTDLIKQYQLRFPSERELISEDMVFNIEYMQYAKGACVIDYTGYFYRTNMSSLTKSYRVDRFAACRYFYEEMKKKLIAYGYNTETIFRLQRYFFIGLRMCIAQETPRKSSQTVLMNLKTIKEICCDEVVQEVIHGYPVNSMDFPQKCFLKLINRNCYIVLYILACLKML